LLNRGDSGRFVASCGKDRIFVPRTGVARTVVTHVARVRDKDHCAGALSGLPDVLLVAFLPRAIVLR